MTDKALMSVVQREVVFYEDVITAVQVEINNQPRILIPLRPICDHLELNWSGQLQRIRRDPILSSELASVYVTHREPGRSDDMTETEATREMICLPLDYLNGWLFGVNPNRVKESIRDRLLRYQRDCFRVLFEAFQEGRLTADLSFEKLLHQNTEAVRAYQMLQAMVKLARSQILIEVKLERMDNRLDAHDKRLEDLEVYLVDPERKITEAQVIEISQAIKVIAEEAEKHSSKKEYGRVYEDMYDLFGISSYRQLPAREFDRMMAWLTERYQQLSGRYDDTPF